MCVIVFVALAMLKLVAFKLAANIMMYEGVGGGFTSTYSYFLSLVHEVK